MLENKPRRVIIVRYGAERVVEIENGPFRLCSDAEYYEGWVIPGPLDPHGEPCYILFTADRIVREA